MELYEIINSKIIEYANGEKESVDELVKENDKEIVREYDKVFEQANKGSDNQYSNEIKEYFNNHHIVTLYEHGYEKKVTKLFFEKLNFYEHIDTYLHPVNYMLLCAYYAEVVKEERKALIKSHNNSEPTEYDIETQVFVGRANLRKYIFDTLELYSRIYGTNLQDHERLEKSLEEIKLSLEQVLSIDFVIDNLELCKNLDMFSINDLIGILRIVTEPNIFGNTNEELTDREERLEQLKQELIKLEPRTLPTGINLPIDKVNNNLWDSFRFNKGIPQGQLQIGISNKNKNMFVITSVDFSEVENVRLSKNLTPYEKTIYDTTANLFSVGNKAVTIDDIFKTMTNGTKKPGSSQRKKIYESLEKLSKVKIYIDNSQAVEQGYQATHFRYEGYLLPIDIITAENEKGKEITGIFKHSAPTFKILPLFDYAKNTGQYITVNNSVLQMELSYTDRNLALRDYLLENIKRKKWLGKTEKDKDPTKWSDRTFKLETIYQKTGLTNELYSKVGNLNRDKKKLLDDMKTLLDQWKAQGLFKSYSITKENLTIKYK